MQDDSSTPSLNDLSALWHMRWFVLIVIAIGFLSAIIAGIVSIIILKNPLVLAIPSSIAVLFRPVILWLFSTRPEQRK
jgi:hypothetical protein